MLSPLFLCVLILAALAAAAMGRRKGAPLPCFLFASFVLPFAAGGFHGYTIAVTCLILTVFLALEVRKAKQLVIPVNPGTAAVGAMFLFSCLTPLWAADRGMAPFGISHWAAVLLFGLYLVQCDAEARNKALDPVPVCGGVMTAAALILLLFPETKPQVTVNGRLAGFFQYPNTYAVFLLAGILLLKDAGSRRFPGLLPLLMTGIVLSGSRTVFLLLAAALVGILLIRKDWKGFLSDGCCLLLAVAAGQLFSRAGLLANADRYTQITPQAGTFLVRLLYYKDALPLILKNPLGLGYLGYRAMEGSIQTGRYYVTYVHNGFLQLLLDLGWIPGLLLAAGFLKSLFSSRISPLRRLLLALLLAHCLLDYDTEFTAIWILLLGLMDLSGGKRLRIGGKLLRIPGVCLLALALWLGAAEGCYYSGNVDTCLALTPFHTDARAYRLSRQEDLRSAEPMADAILEDQPRHPLALQAKASASFLRGEAAAMMEYMERAISHDRYNTELYCDYMAKLYGAIRIYLQSGDRESAGKCVEKILEIPEKMAALEAATDPLAWKTGDDPSMILPEEYRQLLESLKRLA